MEQKNDPVFNLANLSRVKTDKGGYSINVPNDVNKLTLLLEDYTNYFFSFKKGNETSYRTLAMDLNLIVDKTKEVEFFKQTTSVNNIYILVENIMISENNPYLTTDAELHFISREVEIKDKVTGEVEIDYDGYLLELFKDIVQSGFTINGTVSTNISFIVPQSLIDSMTIDELDTLMDSKVAKVFKFVNMMMNQVTYYGNDELNNLEVIFISEINSNNNETKLLKSYIFNTMVEEEVKVNSKLKQLTK